jgi:mRNA interferase HigB
MQDFPAAKAALQLWYAEFIRYDFKNFNELKAVYGNASIVANNRAIFNIKGNDYRLIVKINFYSKQVFIIWFGTHTAYNAIDAATIRYRE